MATLKDLPQDFSEFVELLNENSVRYLIVGGYAVGFHGHARYTKDLDVWIEPTEQNATRLLQALDQFGFGQLNLKVDDFVTPEQIIQLGHEPIRIDLLTSVKGAEFSEAIKSAVDAEVDGVNYVVIGLEQLIAAKKAAGRPQDLGDVDLLS